MKKKRRLWIPFSAGVVLLGTAAVLLYGLYVYQKRFPEVAVYSLVASFDKRPDWIRRSPLVQKTLRNYMHHLMATGEPWTVTNYRAEGKRPDYLVVAVGDSLTAGRRLFENQRFVYFLERLIAYHLPGKTVKVINAGKAGQTILGISRRLERDVLSLEPDLVLLGAGFNGSRIMTQVDGNYVTILPRELYEATYDEVARTIQERLKAKVIIFSPTPVASVYGTKPGIPHGLAQVQVFENFVPVAEKIATKYGFGFADVHAAIKNNPLGDKIFLNDGLHPNALGQLLMTRPLFEAWLELEGIQGVEPFLALIPKAIGKVNLSNKSVARHGNFDKKKKKRRWKPGKKKH